MRLSKALLFGLLATAAATSSAWAQTNIGVTGSVVNSVRSTIGNATKDLKVGDQVVQNETIETASKSRTQILLVDESNLTIGPDAVFVLDELAFDPDPKKSNVAVTMTQGVFRFVSGNLPHESYILKTPTAVIGVRGTVLDIIVEGVTGATTVILREGAALIRSIASGASVPLDVPGLATVVGPGNVAPTPQATPSPAAEAATRNLTAPAGQIQALSVDPNATNPGGGSPVNVQDISESVKEQSSSDEYPN